MSVYDRVKSILVVLNKHFFTVHVNKMSYSSQFREDFFFLASALCVRGETFSSHMKPLGLPPPQNSQPPHFESGISAAAKLDEGRLVVVVADKLRMCGG